MPEMLDLGNVEKNSLNVRGGLFSSRIPLEKYPHSIVSYASCSKKSDVK